MTPSLDIGTLQDGYRSGTLKPAAVIAGIYRRIASCPDPAIWISKFSEDQALTLLDHAPQGPLYGIPFAIKDNIDVAGLPTTCACPAFAYTPARSATVVERLMAAGAIPIGKTNLDQFATGLVGTRSPYGAPRSPFNSDYISGGSSSGSAVAVARGLVSFALGTDTAGSGRVPAAFNNIVGLKPTKGWLSTRGVVPACRSQDTVSIFALNTSDAAAVAEAASGFDAGDDYSRAAPATVRSVVLPQTVRVGVPRDGLTFFSDNRAEQMFTAAIARMAESGAEIVPFDFRPFAEAARLLYGGSWVAERLAAIEGFFTSNEGALDQTVASIISGARDKSAVSVFQGLYELARLTRMADAAWRTFDVMMLPTAATTYTVAEVMADPIALNSNLGAYTNFVNLMDLSAIAVPAGFRDDGLPFGVTFIAQAFEDRCLAELADRFHRGDSNARLGATAYALSATRALPKAAGKSGIVTIAVVGAHLSGQPLNGQLTERGATLRRTARTTTGYRFYALSGTTPAKPGLIRDETGAGGIEVELWDMPVEAFGSFVALIPAPLGIGTLCLDDGTTVLGFLCESYAIRDAIEITDHGGWRAWLAQK